MISKKNLIQAKRTISVLLSKNGQKVLKTVIDNPETSATYIEVKAGLDQSLCAQYLSHLTKCGFLLKEREGKFVYYKPNYDKINLFNITLHNIISL